MPKFQFKLSDHAIVADHGSHDLKDDATAQMEAIKLARSIREARPELIGRNCSILVTTPDGESICSIPIDHML